MKKNNHKKWQPLKTAFKVLLIMIILALLIYLLKELMDFLHHYDLLIKRVDTQQDQINLLQDNLQHSVDTNTQLQSQLHHTQFQLQLEQQKVDQLINDRLTYHEPKISINHEPVTMTVEDIKNEIKPQLKMPDPSIIPIILVGAFQILRGIGSFIPAIP